MKHSFNWYIVIKSDSTQLSSVKLVGELDYVIVCSAPTIHTMYILLVTGTKFRICSGRISGGKRFQVVRQLLSLQLCEKTGSAQEEDSVVKDG